MSEDFETIVGRLGRMSFKKGDYIYIGSANSCLEFRLRRHLRRSKKIYWHIDYLLENEKVWVSQIWVIPKSIECEIANVFNKKLSCKIVKKGFGSSDCKCLSHLFYIKDRERIEKILKKTDFSIYYSFSN